MVCSQSVEGELRDPWYHVPMISKEAPLVTTCMTLNYELLCKINRMLVPFFARLI